LSYQVPYSLGLWLQPIWCTSVAALLQSFQFPIHWDCGCNLICKESLCLLERFQFPIHWDCGCNIKRHLSNNPDCKGFSSLFIGIVAATPNWNYVEIAGHLVSVPYSLGLWLQPHSCPKVVILKLCEFQFPIHWDCGCN